AGHHLEQFTGNMVSGTDTGRRHLDLAGIGFGMGDELGNRLDRHGWIHLHDKGLAMNARDRRDVADQVEIELVVERGVDRIHRSGHKERIPVRGRVYDRLGGDIASRARPILDDKLLTETLRQPLSYQARHDVGGTTGGKSDNDAHRPGRIALRPSDARDSRQCGSAGGQMQKMPPVGKFHWRPSPSSPGSASNLLSTTGRVAAATPAQSREPCRINGSLTGTADPRFPMEHSMRTMTRTIALAFVLLGLASAPLAAQANPPPPSNPPGAQPTGPQYQGPSLQAPQAQSPQPQGPQYSSNEIVDAGHRFFGTISSGLAQIVEQAGSQFGLPNGYVLGQEGGGAVVAGLRYGEGILYTKNAGDLRVFWQGPSLGYDFGVEGARTMMLIYNLPATDAIYQRFAGIGGSAYFVGGLGMTALTMNDIVVVPIRTGVGIRLGANVGYLK